MDFDVFSLLESLGKGVVWLLEKIWLAWHGTYLFLIPLLGEAGALLIVTLVPVIIGLAVLYMTIAKTQIGIETFGHSSFGYGLIAVGVIITIVFYIWILPML